MLASRGSRDLGRGVEPVDDPEEAARLRAQARGVLLRMLALGVAGSLVFLAF